MKLLHLTKERLHVIETRPRGLVAAHDIADTLIELDAQDARVQELETALAAKDAEIANLRAKYLGSEDYWARFQIVQSGPPGRFHVYGIRKSDELMIGLGYAYLHDARIAALETALQELSSRVGLTHYRIFQAEIDAARVLLQDTAPLKS